jgi:hypothetical protein
MPDPRTAHASMASEARIINGLSRKYLASITSANAFSSKIVADHQVQIADPPLSPSPPCSNSVRLHTPRLQERLWISITGIPSP